MAFNIRILEAEAIVPDNSRIPGFPHSKRSFHPNPYQSLVLWYIFGVVMGAEIYVVGASA